MAYFKYLIIVINITLIRLINIVWLPVVIPYRKTARKIVYTYMYNADKEASKCTTIWCSKYYRYADNSKINIKKYFLYLWWYYTVWIWLNDRVDSDYYDTSIIEKLYKQNTFLSKGILYILNKYRYDKNSYILVSWLNNLILPDNNYEYSNCLIYTSDELFYFNIFGYDFGYKIVKYIYSKKCYHLCFFKDIVTVEDSGL